jgi:peptidoglycan/xylan/chitin deacetylase (PgdA/CDA1 family)
MKLLRRTAAAALVLVAVLAVVYPLHRSRTFQLFGEIVPRVETRDSVVALTFDDGPTARQADELLDYLRANRVRATFYVTGSGVAEQPAVARRLVADRHELGNHTYSHRAMVLRSPGFIRAEVERTDSAIRGVGFRGPITFRPPYTKKLFGLPLYLARTGRVTVTCDIEPESYSAVDGDAERIATHVLERVRPGSIILLHPWYRSREASRRAVPAIVEGLRARGYELVTVRELRASELAATTAQSPPAGTRADN